MVIMFENIKIVLEYQFHYRNLFKIFIPNILDRMNMFVRNETRQKERLISFRFLINSTNILV
jgi:hypothetical protein